MLFLGLGTGLGAAMIVDNVGAADGTCASSLQEGPQFRRLCRRTRPGKTRPEEMAQIRLRRRGAAARGDGARLCRHRRRQCRASSTNCRPIAGAATINARSRAGFGSGETNRSGSDFAVDGTPIANIRAGRKSRRRNVTPPTAAHSPPARVWCMPRRLNGLAAARPSFRIPMTRQTLSFSIATACSSIPRSSPRASRPSF